jgi:hypothetical protein
MYRISNVYEQTLHFAIIYHRQLEPVDKLLATAQERLSDPQTLSLFPKGHAPGRFLCQGLQVR